MYFDSVSSINEKYDPELAKLKNKFHNLFERIQRDEELRPLFEKYVGNFNASEKKQLKGLIYEGEKLLLLKPLDWVECNLIKQDLKQLEKDLRENHHEVPNKELNGQLLWKQWGIGKLLNSLHQVEAIEAIDMLKHQKNAAIKKCKTAEERLCVLKKYHARISKVKMQSIIAILREKQISDEEKKGLKKAFRSALNSYQRTERFGAMSPEQYQNLFIEAQQKVKWEEELNKLLENSEHRHLDGFLSYHVQEYINWVTKHHAHRRVSSLSWAMGRICAMLGDKELLEKYRHDIGTSEVRSDIRQVWNLWDSDKVPTRFLIIANLLSHPVKGDLGDFIAKKTHSLTFEQACQKLEAPLGKQRIELLNRLKNTLLHDRLAKQKLTHKALSYIHDAAQDGKHLDRKPQSISTMGKFGNWLKRLWGITKVRGKERYLKLALNFPTALLVGQIVSAGVGLCAVGVAMGAIAINPFGLLAIFGILALVGTGVGITLGANYLISRWTYKKTGSIPWKSPKDFVKEHKGTLSKARSALIRDFTKFQLLTAVQYMGKEWEGLSKSEKQDLTNRAKSFTKSATHQMRDLKEAYEKGQLKAQELLYRSIEKVDQSIREKEGLLQWKMYQLLLEELKFQINTIAIREWKAYSGALAKEIADEDPVNPFVKEFDGMIQDFLDTEFTNNEKRDFVKALHQELDYWYDPNQPKGKEKGFFQKQFEDLGAAIEQADFDPTDMISFAEDFIANPVVQQVVLEG